jgi:hypothetical protein
MMVSPTKPSRLDPQPRRTSPVSNDLSRILKQWPYESGQINVRLITGDDNEPKVQMRLDLGLLQMEAFGRPDGERPQGYESLLEYFESLVEESGFDPQQAIDSEESGFEEASDIEPDDEDDPFMLSDEDCRALREEAVQYYHRYISLLVLGDFMGVVRDTSRNLRVIEFCEAHAEEDEDREVLKQFRPYITMMRTRALASQMLADNEPKAAMVAIDDGLAQLRRIYDDLGKADAYESSHEAQLLRGMRDELVKKLPSSQRTELKQRLEEAIRSENYELAAILRDELRMLKE